ncbi:MAG TPA: FtsQ-type POTRA domain-containing protein [Bryobacteraceae bacterium]|nr:FtsQ-type POTRA domain-containing protein [Bryobacteraceae bacterium]
MALGVAGVSTAWAGFKVRQYVLEDPQFVFSSNTPGALTIQGLNYTSYTKVLRVFILDFDHSVFSIPLAERRRRLLAIDWVEDASVSRIWPDRLLVRIRERTPVAFVIFRSGVLLMDAHGVLLEPPLQAHFAFPVLSGVRENETEDQRCERVRALLRLQQDMGYMAKDVSEVDTADPANIRIVAQVENRAVELMMGDGNFAQRYQNFLAHYPEIGKRSPNVKSFDLRLDGQVTARE